MKVSSGRSMAAVSDESVIKELVKLRVFAFFWVFSTTCPSPIGLTP